MEQFIISNPVPTPEQMADQLGVSRERLEEIRVIMRTPIRRAASKPKQAASSLTGTPGQSKKKTPPRAKAKAR